MNRISCDICMDLLPLVVDDVAGQDSKNNALEHIQTCEKCKHYYEQNEKPMMDTTKVTAKIKRQLFVLAMVVAFVLISGILFMGNAFVGNPISKMFATNTAKKHIEQNYGDTDFVIREVNYSFKTGGYYARIESPSSIDSNFSIELSGMGKFQ